MAKKTQSLTLRMDADNAERLITLASETGTSRSEVVRGLIRGAQPLEKAKDNPYKELGTSGLQRFGGSLREEKLRELRGAAGRQMYREMRQNNAVISAVFFAIEMALRQVRWFAESASDAPKDKATAEFLEQNIHDMSFTWDDTLQFILGMLEQGFSVLELVYKRRQGTNPRRYRGVTPTVSQYSDGRMGWRKWAPRPANSLAVGDAWKFDDAGGVQGVNQVSPPDYVKQFIPTERLLLFRTTPAPANSPEGMSILRPIYESYYYATNLQEIEGIGVERDLAGLPVVYLGRGCSLSGPNSDYTLAKKLVRNIRRDEQEGVVIPRPKMGSAGEGEGMLLELLSSGGGRQFAVGEIINRYHRQMAMACLAQFIMLGMEKVGSYALSRHQGDFFNLAVSAWADSIAQTVNRHAVPRLFRLNTFGVKELPRLSHTAVGVPDLDGLAKYVNALVGAEVLTPDDELEHYLREAAQFPERKEMTLEGVTKADDGPEGERLKYRKTLQRKYSKWLSGMAGDLVDEDDPAERRKRLAAALAALALLLKQTGREELPKALGIGRKGEAPSPQAMKDLARKLEENEQYLGTPPSEDELERMEGGAGRVAGDTFVWAVGRKLIVSSEEEEADELTVVGAGQSLRSRIGSYDGLWWSLVFYGLIDWGKEHEPDARVRWVLLPGVAHCVECPELAHEYESFDDLVKMPSETICNGNCRCHLEIHRNGRWEWL